MFRPRKKRRSYSMIELIGALAVFGMLSAAYMQHRWIIRTQSIRFTQESQGILVLENSVERMAAQKRLSEARARTILLEEFSRYPMQRKAELEPRLLRLDDGRYELAIRRADGMAVAKIYVRGAQ